VIGADATVTTAIAQTSNFELHTAYPLLASKLLTSIRLLANVSGQFAKQYVRGLKANKKVIADRLARNPMLATALAPHIGYDAAALIAKEAIEKEMTILEIAKKRTKIPEKKLRELLDPRKMV
jgi:fumarate hydratase class II